MNLYALFIFYNLYKMDNNYQNFNITRMYDILNQLTINIDNLDLSITYKHATNLLFADIKKILELDNEIRYHVVKDWKYGNAFELTYDHHMHNNQLYYTMTWEESFTSTLISVRNIDNII